MKKFNFLVGVVSTIFLSACGGGSDGHPEGNSWLIGGWFACEYDLFDQCFVLDDDGTVYNANGTWSRVELKNDLCPYANIGNCFNSTTPRIDVKIKSSGTYRVNGNSVSIFLSDGTGFIMKLEDTAFSGVKKATDPDGDFEYIAKYNGTIAF